MKMSLLKNIILCNKTKEFLIPMRFYSSRNNRINNNLFFSTSTDTTPKSGNESDLTGEQLVKAKENNLQEEFQKERKTLQTQIDELQDKYKRSLAETENVRQRLQKQIQDTKIFGIQSFCKDLLEVADILGKATSSVSNDELTSQKNVILINLFEGLIMTETQLTKVFNRHGLDKINPLIGDKFDPNFHEALFQKPINLEKKEVSGTIADVSKIGYKLHNRTIRPALVGVFASNN